MKRSGIATTVCYLLLAACSAWYILPFCWALVTSVKQPGMVFDGRWLPYTRSNTISVDDRETEMRIVEERGDRFLVRLSGTGELREVPRADVERVSPDWRNYRDAWTIVPFGRYFLNSFFISLCITIGQLITCSLGGYAFSRLTFPGRDLIFLLYLATLMIPGPVLTVPIYVLMREYHLLNTYEGAILPGLFSAYGTFLLRQFFSTIPRELEDAARIDGAGRFGVYLRIILPLSGPALAALATFVFIGSWNDYFWPSIVLTDPDKLTLPVGLAHLNDMYVFQYGRLMAGSMISMAPALLIYLLFQRFVTRGVVMTGLKG
ncbi:MAG: carbohydrate ABC transporter permease [Bacteroidota bacterium]